MLSKLKQLGIILAAVFLGSALMAHATTTLFPQSGGTGTSTPPAYGQVLVGTAAGVYQLQATSTLGIAGGSGAVSSVFARTGAVVAQTGDYTTSQVPEGTNLYYTAARSLASFITNLAATTSVASITALPNLSLPYSQLTGIPASFAYPFPSNATSTLLTLSGGATIGGTFTLSALGAGELYTNSSGVVGTGATTTVSCAGSVSCSPFTTFGASPFTITGLGTGGTGLSTTSPVSASNLLVYSSAGAGSAFGVATSTLTTSSPLTGSFTQIGSGGTLGCQTASGSQAGCLSAADWTTFNNKTSNTGTVTSVVAGTGLSGGTITTTGTIAVNTTQNITTLSNLTVAGLVQSTSGGVLSSALLTSGQVTTALGYTPGTGTVNSGSANQMAYYASSGSTLSGSGLFTFATGGGNAQLTVGGAGGHGIFSVTDGTFSNFISSIATSTFNAPYGIDLEGGGCFAIAGVCIGGGTGTNYFTNSGVSTFLSTGTNLGIGTTTPFGELAISAQAGTNYPGNFLFNISSSTASATTSIFSILNTGAAALAGPLTLSGNLVMGTNNISTVGAITSTGVWFNNPSASAGQFAGIDDTSTYSGTSGTSASTAGFFQITRSGSTGGNAGTTNGIQSFARYSGTGTQVDLRGVYGQAQNTGSGTTSTGYGIYGDTCTGTVTNCLAGGFNGNVWINNNLGIGTTTPFYALSVGTAGTTFGSILSVEDTLATTTTMTVDWSKGNQQLIQIGTAATSVAFSKPVDGATLRLVVCNPPASSAGALTFTGVQWSAGIAPTQTTTAKVCDVWSFIATQATSTVTSTVSIFGSQSPNFP